MTQFNKNTPESMSTTEKINILRNLTGIHVSDQQLQQLLTKAKGDLEAAANTYFLSMDIEAATSTSKASSQSVQLPIMDSFSSSPLSNLETMSSSLPGKRKRAPGTNSFYIGDLVMTGWSLLKGNNLVKQGDSCTMHRPKPNVHFTKKRRAFGGQTGGDTVVRFTNLQGQEIGRLEKDASKYISILIDQDLCEFKGIIVYCPSTLTLGDDIILQFRCYLKVSAFDSMASIHTRDSRSHHSLKEFSSETEQEASKRLRTLALIAFMRALSLRPTRSAIRSISGHDNEDEIHKLIEQSVSTVDSSSLHDTSGEEEAQESVKEVTDDQLDTIYEKAQLFDAQISPMDEPDTMCLSLKPYQKRALAWMVLKESTMYDAGDVDTRSMHPLWEEFAFPSEQNDSEYTHFYMNTYSGDLSLIFPESSTQERGGILADEMGLGKTIEMLSLIHTNRFKPGMPTPDNKRFKSPTTLVICPMSLLAQWRDEMVRGSHPNTLSIDVYYGEGRNNDMRNRLDRWDGTAPDVLITTYGTILSEWGKKDSKLFKLEFWRVILDEAHQIKNRQSKTSRACCDIRSPRRWALSGTPIQNKLEDLYALVRFLKHEPWAHYTFWRAFITLPFQKKSPKALIAVKSVLEPIVLRRTKAMHDENGNPIISLPKKAINIEYLDFTLQEQEIYDSLYNDSKTKFSHFCESGKALSNYASIFQLLMRLRQVSCHPLLALSSGSEGQKKIMTDSEGLISLEKLIEKYSSNDTENTSTEDTSYSVEVLRNLLKRQKNVQSEGKVDSETRMDIDEECRICFETVDSMIMLKCAHMACRPCVMDFLQKFEDRGMEGHCPICRHGPVNPDDLLEVSRRQDSHNQLLNEDTGLTSLNIRQAVGGYKPSTKINALIRHLRLYEQEGHRTVVFSQFTSFLDIIQVALAETNITYARLDGTQSQTHREKVLSEFSSENTSQNVNVLLISLRAGGVGINLTCASRVIIMDPWWNFAVESQAIDRVHRLGQQKDVVITRFIMKDTVEERILEVQDRKHMLTTQLYMSKEEGKLRQLQDLKILFRSSSKR
ncbi:SNF2 family N-terminal domain-containing protein [Spinellus fusiger]|nr:SNF2 family N-terminal domain-containing protein [Spinellus fusiger]